jgi:plasmid stability protein
MKVRDMKPTGVRIPPDMKKALKHIAVDNGRSLNAEVVDRLKKSLEAENEAT